MLSFYRRSWARYGDYSYGLYIYAFPVQQIFALLGIYRSGLLLYFLSSTVVTLILATLSCYLVERPALRLRQAKPSWLAWRPEKSS